MLIIQKRKWLFLIVKIIQIHTSMFTYGGIPIKVVQEFKCLGTWFHETGKRVHMIRYRLNQGKKALACWNAQTQYLGTAM